MGLFDGFKNSIGGGIGGAFGGMAGGVAGIPGMFMGGKLGNYGGNKLQGLAGMGGDQGDYMSGDYSGMSGYPSYVGMEPDSLGISGQFSGPNMPLDKFAGESLRTGLSPTTTLALNQNRLGANAGRDQARALASGMGKDASAQLSMKGGLGGGAAERIGKYATNVGMEAGQGADATASNNRAGLMIADENARNGNLAQASGLVTGDRNSRYSMLAGDLQRKQGELDRRNAFNMNNYNQQMAAWGAGKQADATANSGKK